MFVDNYEVLRLFDTFSLKVCLISVQIHFEFLK